MERQLQTERFVHLHVWRNLIEVDATVSLHVVLGVDLQVFIRVHRYQHRTDVSLRKREQSGHIVIK